MVDKGSGSGLVQPVGRARSYFTVAVIVLALLLSALDRHILTLLVHPIQAELGFSDSQIALLHGAGFVLVHAIATLGVGWLSDRYDRGRILLIGVAFWSFMTALCGFARSFTALMAARGGVGLGEASVTPTSYSLVADHFPPERRGRMTGILSAAVTLGGGAALIVGGLVLGLIGTQDVSVPILGELAPWRTAFLVVGLAGLPVVVLVAFIRDPRERRLRPRAAEGISETVHVVSGPSALQHIRGHWKTFGAIFIAAGCNGVMSTGAVAWGPTMLFRRLGTPADQVGYLIGTALMVGGILGAISAASLSDRWIARSLSGGRIRGHVVILPLSLAGLLLFCFAPTAGLAAVGFGVCLFSANAISALHYTAMQDLSSPSNRAQMIAILHFVATLLSYTIGPSLVAAISDFVLHDPDKIHVAIMIAAAPLAVVGAVTSFFARRAYSRTSDMMLAPARPPAA